MQRRHMCTLWQELNDYPEASCPTTHLLQGTANHGTHRIYGGGHPQISGTRIALGCSLLLNDILTSSTSGSRKPPYLFGPPTVALGAHVRANLIYVRDSTSRGHRHRFLQ
eukprot:GHVT01005680.1.p1 GENE.GHVT01005680.1~~GHVT01005680.1.p1  ORF type:complete len:110 (-),score=2.75 GHVT01005680.1:206-535(-)